MRYVSYNFFMVIEIDIVNGMRNSVMIVVSKIVIKIIVVICVEGLFDVCGWLVECSMFE